MKRYFEVNHWASRLTLAAFAMAMLSPAAHADHWRRYKGALDYDPPAVRHVHYAPQRVVYLERHSDAAPLFAGLIGGIVLGASSRRAGRRRPRSSPRSTTGTRGAMSASLRSRFTSRTSAAP